MKKIKKIDAPEQVSDEIVVDSRDVERAEAVSMLRKSKDPEAGSTVIVDGELVTSRPAGR